MPIPDAKDIADRRHPTWRKHAQWWRWLAHSLECGEVYRDAAYGSTTYGAVGLAGGPIGLRSMPVRNLYRYKTEVPDFDRGEQEHPDYALRLARTPVPTYMPEAIDAHLAEVYSQEIRRGHAMPELDTLLGGWMDNIDGTDTALDEWVPEVVMPYLLALGCLDLAFDRPAPRPGAGELTVRDAEDEGLGRCVARVVFPWNVLDWELEPNSSRYAWVLDQEAGGEGSSLDRRDWRLRLWTADSWQLFDGDGRPLEGGDHRFGRVPQFRAFDRQNVRLGHVGRARYEAIAEIQREAYNKESELVLSSARHSYPVAQAPRTMLQQEGPDGTARDIPITPSRVLMMGTDAGGNPAGLEYVDVPQGPGDSLRRDQDRLRDLVDRAAKLTKPAGARGTDANTVAQSGISKLVDEKPGKLLARQLARTGYKLEWEAIDTALCVLRGRPTTPAERDGIEVVYPTNFDLIGTSEWTNLVIDFLGFLDRAASLPEELAIPIGERFIRLVFPGMDDAGYEELDAALARDLAEGRAARGEMQAALQQAQQARQAATAAGKDTGPAPPAAGGGPDGTDTQAA